MKGWSFSGLVAASLFLSASFSPSLIPRHWAYQGVISGIVTAAGYGLGTFVGFGWRQLPLPVPSPAFALAAWRTLALVAPIAAAGMAWLGVGWQRELHRLMGMEAPSAWGAPGALAAGLLLAWLLVAGARSIRTAVRRVGAALSRWLPPRLATGLGALLVALLIVGFLDGVVVRSLFNVADETFRLTDEAAPEDVVQPTSPLVSGSPPSAASWDDLGSKGRSFVAGAPDKQALTDFTGAPALEPIRVYAGLASAPDIEDRVTIVMEELERTGAFGRAVLCVVNTTGTGWVDPLAAMALEYLWGGDTAVAALQYSYLPSWVSFLVDSARAREAGAALFNAIYDRWVLLPEDERPLLVVFGESLGTDGSEAAFSGLADIRNRTDGALWVGPPNFSQLWSEFTGSRDPKSPQRRPVYEGGETVRFATQSADVDPDDTNWSRPRVLYLQHASDPVVWWSPRLLLRQPDWLREPPGPDVLPEVRWYPLVTFWQLSADLANSKKVPTGHGHNYGAEFADGWAAVATPPEWTPADTVRLRRLLVTHIDGGRSASPDA